MRRQRLADILKGLIVIGVVFAFLSSFDWFRILLRNLFIGIIVVCCILLVWYGYKFYRKVRLR